MFDRRLLNITVVIIFCGISTAIAVPPPSASVSGVKNIGWQPGNCEVASFGQLVQQRDPTVTPAEVVVRAGVCTQALWSGSGNNRVLVDHPRFIDMGKRVDAARLFGLGYAVAWKSIGARPFGIAKQADSLTTFKTTDEAIVRLKELIAEGKPVQVHVDTGWLVNYSGRGSHFVVVHAYDENDVYYCENGGPDGTNENVALSWSDFTEAWTQIAHFDPRYPGNECFMLWLTTDPIRLNDDWILAWLARDIEATNTKKQPTGPYAIRAAAAAIRGGADGDTAFNGWMCSILGNWRPYMVEFLDDAGHSDLADLFEQACGKWKTILDMPPSNPDWDAICNLMDEAADIEEQVEAEMLALGDNLGPVQLFAPLDGENLSTFENCTFRWAQMPDVSKTAVQIAMTGNFADKRGSGIFRPKKNQWFISMTKNDWLKVLRKDDGDRQLSWRVIGPAKETGSISTGWTLGWDVQQMVSTAPDDAYTFAANELVQFKFDSPYIAMKPCVVISTTGDFTDNKSRIVLKPAKGQTDIFFKTSTLSALKKKDDGNGIVYWRVEDASAKKTTVVPSEERLLNLP